MKSVYEILKFQKDNALKNGLYRLTQISFCYNSSLIEACLSYQDSYKELLAEHFTKEEAQSV